MYSSILLIDDDPIQNLINSKLIGKIDVTDNLMVAANGQEAHEKYLKGSVDHPDIIFLDINMPIMNGWQFLDLLSIEFNGFKPRIFMLTSSVSPGDIERSSGHGMVEGFITKPLTMDKLKFLKTNSSQP